MVNGSKVKSLSKDVYVTSPYVDQAIVKGQDELEVGKGREG